MPTLLDAFRINPPPVDLASTAEVNRQGILHSEVFMVAACMLHGSVYS